MINGSTADRSHRKVTAQESVEVAQFTATINTALQLLERNVKEYSLLLANDSPSTLDNNPSVLWFSRIQIVNTIYHCWKDFALLHFSHRSDRSQHRNHNHTTGTPSPYPNHHNRNISSPMDGVVLASPRQLVQSLEQMSVLLPKHFHYDITTMNLILTVLVQQAPTAQVAPIIGEQLLDFIRANESNTTVDGGNTNPFHMTPTSDTYAIVIQAWIDSGLPETKSKVDQLLKEFHGTVANCATNNDSVAWTTTSSPSNFSINHTKNASHDASISNPQNISMHGIGGADQLLPYMMVMKYYSAQKNSKMVKNIYYEIEQNATLKSHINPVNLSHILRFVVLDSNDYDFIDHIFTSINELLTADNYVNSNDTDHHRPTNSLDAMARYMLCKTSEKLMNYYRDQIMIVPRPSDDTATEYLRRAEYIYKCTEQFLYFDKVGMYLNKISSPVFVHQSSHFPDVVAVWTRNTMIDIYGSMGQIELLEEFFHNVISKAPNTRAYNMLIKAYGKCNLPDRAEAIVRRMLHKESTTKANIRTLNTLLNCWAISKVPEYQMVAIERAFNIYYWMKNNQQCIDLQIEPNIITFATLMKCVISTASSRFKRLNERNSDFIDIPEKIDTILQEMDDRRRNGDETLKPHVGIYSGAIKALLLANDPRRAEDMLKNLEEAFYNHDDCSDDDSKSRSLPSAATPFDVSSVEEIVSFTLHTYIPFFKFYSRMRSTTGAQSAEKMHNHMRALSLKKSDPKLKPNNVTYNLILEAWVNSGDPSAAKNLWNIYEQMKKVDKLTIGYDTFAILINALSCNTKGVRNKRRLLQLLHEVHANKVNTRNGSFYVIAIKGLMARMAREDVIAVTEVMKLLIDSYIQGHFTWDTDRLDRAKFNWVIATYIESNELELAIFFIEDMIQRAAQTKRVTNSAPLDVSWIGPDLNVILDLRKAWTKNTGSIQKNYFIAKIDDEIIPAMVRLLNIEKGNIRHDQPTQPPAQNQRQRRRRPQQASVS